LLFTNVIVGTKLRLFFNVFITKISRIDKRVYICSMKKYKKQEVKEILNEALVRYNHSSFIKDDPIQIPHQYQKLQDIEITAFWTSMLAWGQRKTIINKSTLLFGMMDNAPHDFILNHKESDLKPFESFKHRTFQPIDCLYFIRFFKRYYSENETLEQAFAQYDHPASKDVESMLVGFHDLFFDDEYAPKRTRKHIATPARKSSCKRLNMFLRWMVRHDQNNVDFGLWKNIPTSKLLVPLDVHVRRVATRLGLLKRPQNDFRAVQELTAELRKFDANDPVKYDFALFGIGLSGMLDI